MKKIFTLLMIICICITFVDARTVLASSDRIIETDIDIIGTEGNIIVVEDNEKSFFYDGKNILSIGGVASGAISMLEGGDIIGELPGMSIRINSKNIKGKFEYPNLDNTRIGVWDLEWIFTPDDPIYPIVKGVQTIDVRENEELQQERAIEAIALTKAKLSLEAKDTFDINLKNKVKGSRYTWTTSNKKVAKVNKKNGIVTALRKGKAVVSCKITLPDGTVKTLKANVTVK